MKRLLIILLITFISQSLIAQDATFNLDRKIDIQSITSTIQNIKINVSESTTFVHLSIECQVYAGNLTIEILDPNGVKKGNFSIESQVKKGKQKKGMIRLATELIEGQINQSLNTPINGDWIVKIIPEEASAVINVRTKHHINY